METTRFYTALLISFLLPATLFADVTIPGPSDPSLFEGVINLPGDSTDTITDAAGLINIGGDLGPNVQVNLGVDGSVAGLSTVVSEGGELNINGGTVASSILNLDDGGVLNVTSGSIESGIFALNAGSLANISGGNITNGVIAVLPDSELNLFGREFFLNGSLLTDLNLGEAFIINDRDVELSGLLADGSAFSFELNGEFINNGIRDQFDPAATLTVTAVPEPSSMAILLVGVGMAGIRRKRSAA